MTDYARFSQLSQPAGVTWSADRFTATFDGVSIYNTWVASKLTTGKFVFCMTYGSACTSGISDTGDLSGDNVVNGVYLRENGDLNTVTAGGATTITNISGTTSGSTAMWAFDAGAKLAWVTIDGTNWYGAAGTALPTSSVVAGTGGISLSMITTGANPLSHLYSGSGTVVLNSGASSYPWAVPSGFSSLHATLDVQQLILGQTGDAVSFTWQSNNAGGLEYSTDGGSTWTACGGTTTGSSGTATLAAFGSAGASKVIIRDATVTTDQVVTPVFILDALPSGTGSLLASFVGQFPLSDGDSSHPTLTTAFAPSESIIYALSIGVSHNGAGAVGGSASLRIQNDEAPGKGALFDNQSVFSSSGIGSASTWTGITPDTGPQYVPITNYSQQTGTITMTEPGSLPGVPVVNAEISNNGTNATFVNRTDPSSDNWPVPYDFMSLAFNTSFINETFLYALAVWAPSVAETLTLTGASCRPGGTLSLAGDWVGGPVTGLNISVDGGAFVPAASYTPSGTLSSGTFSATDGTLTAGTHSVQAQDSVTLLDSNTLTIDVEFETITLTTLGGSIGGTLSFGGTSSFGPPSNVDVAVNGTWATSTSFTTSAGTIAAPLSGTGPTSLSAGTLVVQLRDHSDHTVLSNFGTLVLSATETITLTSATGTLGQILALAGTSDNGPPPGLNVTLDHGATFAPVTGYMTTGGTTAAPWSANGPLLSSTGTYVIGVQDDVNTGVISNYLTLVVAPQTEQLELLAVNGSLGANFTLGGLTLYGPAADLDVQVQASGPWSAVTDYSSSSDTLSATWSGVGPLITAYGIYPVRVRDSSNNSIISNTIYFQIGPNPPPPPPPFSPIPWPGAQFPAIWLAETLKSYLYVEYQDDDNLQSFVQAYNDYTQIYLNSFIALNLPIYTSENITGDLLDWVAQGLYGIKRPVLPSGISRSLGPLNTVVLNTLPLNKRKVIGPTVFYATSDDVFKRIITWSFFKGDGRQFSIRWLKRRIMRFLFGVNGTNFIASETYPVSVTFGTDNQVDINFPNGLRTIASGAIFNTFAMNTMALNRLNSSFTPASTPEFAPVFKAAVDAGVLPLPFQFTYVVNL